MKKLFCILALFSVLMGAAWAEGFDLSALSFQELAALRDRAQLEMFSRDEWQEVTVPQGVYQVGVQIPAGTWSVRSHEGRNTRVAWGEELDASGHDIGYSSFRRDMAYIYNPDYRSYDAGDRTEYTFTVKDGDYIVIDNGPATFTPGGVTPSFTFK